MANITGKHKKDLTSNMEDYLETIYVLGGEGSSVRVKGISDKLGVKKSSVNNAVKVLAEKGFVAHKRYGSVKLTAMGEKASRKIKRRHDMLVRFLSEILGVDREAAVMDACKVEHVISSDTSDKLGKFLEFVDTVPTGAKPKWLLNFKYFVSNGKKPCGIESKPGKRRENGKNKEKPS
ncbi:MAG TPA: metal-dependent transcriptional regulator [Candidatus Omnitrophota bacterium]|nr:metal-dependent transcriptional regulator [Candidatus Omnitrophota bacterium]